MTTLANARLASFDLETDGPDPEDARIVTATVLLLGAGQPRMDAAWLVKPERPIPAEATAVHGIETATAERDGIDRGGAIQEIAAAIVWALSNGCALVAFNAAYDVTVLDRECRRVGVPTVTERLNGAPLAPVVDPFVIDKQMDRFRRGKRTLGATCAVYGVELEGAHDSTADALAAARLAYKLAARFPEVGNAELGDLHVAQIEWRAQQSASLEEYFRAQGKNESVNGEWPLQLVGGA